MASSNASQRQNSTALNSDSRARSPRVFVTRVRQISTVSPSGTKNSVCAAIPARREPISV